MRWVYVRWVDSANLFQDRWAKLEDIDDEQTFCETLGFLVKVNDHSYYVAGSIAPEEIGSVMQIPKVAVKELKEVEHGTEEASRLQGRSEEDPVGGLLCKGGGCDPCLCDS